MVSTDVLKHIVDGSNRYSGGGGYSIQLEKKTQFLSNLEYSFNVCSERHFHLKRSMLILKK